jgi:lysophospholipase L1-like esterase
MSQAFSKPEMAKAYYRFTSRVTACAALLLCCAAAAAASPVTLTLGPVRNSGFAVPPDFIGLSFETGSELPNKNRVAGHLFCATNTQLATLFQNIGIHNLRLGGGTVDLPATPIPGPEEIDDVFAFARQAGNLSVIYSLRLLNGEAGEDSGKPGDSYLAGYIWQRYQAQLKYFAIGNEPDWKSYHRPDPTLTNYPSYLDKWRKFAAAIRARAPGAVFIGPDTGSYTSSTFHKGKSWTQRFADDARPSGFVAAIAQHYYPGAQPGRMSAQKAIDAMLSAAWVTKKYPWLYKHNLAPVLAVGLPYRLTESNDYLGGVKDASDAFASALWALDYLHWWAAHGCAGVNFHNKSWLLTDTVYLDAAGNYQIHPKAYGIKAFEMGSRGYIQPLTISNSNGLNLTAYAVGDTNQLCVTIINKEHGRGAREASVTIDGGEAGVSAAAMFLIAPNGDAGATIGVTLGGAAITNNTPWNGQWIALGQLTNSQCTLKLPAASAVVVALGTLAPSATIASLQPAHNFSRWEKEIAAYERIDRTNPPPHGGLVFIGSSTIARWKTLAQDFPGQPVINRGFGGSEIIDSAYFADRIIVPYAPRKVFLRAGGNDLFAGKSPEQVFADFKEFATRVRAKLPETEIVFISLSPSIARWKQAAKEKQVNQMVEEYCRQHEHMIYLETYSISLDANGQPRPELFVADKLHFNAEGYRLLAEKVRPYVAE